MSKILTDQQIQQYHDDGFIAPLRVMPEDEAFSIKLSLKKQKERFLMSLMQKIAIIYISFFRFLMNWLTTR